MKKKILLAVLVAMSSTGGAIAADANAATLAEVDLGMAIYPKDCLFEVGSMPRRRKPPQHK